jgi:hypothetical protein
MQLLKYDYALPRNRKINTLQARIRGGGGGVEGGATMDFISVIYIICIYINTSKIPLAGFNSTGERAEHLLSFLESCFEALNCLCNKE